MSFNYNYVPGRIFYDITVTNINTNLSSNPELAFTETRLNPLVVDPSKYYMSIVRFSLDTPSLPIWLPTIQPAQSDVNLTIYSVSMTCNNCTVQQYINFVPQDQSQPLPNPPVYSYLKLQQFCAYYYVFSYEYVIQLINTALTTCFNTLASQTTLNTSAPYLKWNSVTNTATLLSDSSSYSSTATNPIKLYFNNALFQLFSSFPMFIENPTSSQGLNYQISCDAYTNASTDVINGVTYLLCNQDYSTASMWSPVSSVVFTTNTMPIVAELLSAPSIFYDNVSYQSTNNTGISNIITDFQASDMSYIPYLSYQPNIYRYVELFGSCPLTTVDIRCFWKTKVNQLVPFTLNAGCSASIKIMFCLKDNIN
jgi:hypothetical protein